jgi:alpha-L-fucosidase
MHPYTTKSRTEHRSIDRLENVGRIAARWISAVMAISLAALSALAQPITNANAALNSAHEAGLRRFQDAKFGLFLHWGLYTVPAGEWNGNTGLGEWFQIQTRMPLAQYSKFAEQFSPAKFDAKEWVKHVKDAGIKYIVITSKHHDGFAMYDSKVSDYNVVKATPWHHDPMKDLAAACQEADIQFCFYYSIPDWHSPNFPAQYSQRRFHGDPNPNADLEKYVPYMKEQIREILTGYGPIGYLWFDDGGAFEGVDRAQRARLIHAQEIAEEIHQLQPGCVINDRLGLPGDCDTPEQSIPGTRPRRFFEVCMSLNGHWSYNKNDHRWKDAKTVVHNLVDVVSKGGNYLLGLGPTPEGVFPSEALPVLEGIGQWLGTNSESVYGAGASPFNRMPFDGRCTQKPGTLYLHVFTWPNDNQVLVPIANKVKRAYLLADPRREALEVTVSQDGVTIKPRAQNLDPIDAVIALEIEGEPKLLAVASQNLAEGKPVEVSSVWPGRENELNKSHITDGDTGTLWAAAQADRSGWVQVDLQKECDVSRASLSDAPYGRTRAFDLEARVNGEWKKVAEGTRIGENLNLSFTPVKAQLFRLNIRNASDTPTLAEFQLFAK